MKDTDEVNILYMKGRERMKSVSKRYLSFILSLLMAMTIFTGLDLGDINAQALSGDTLKNADTEAILEDMGLGWNLGNSLDSNRRFRVLTRKLDGAILKQLRLL